MSDATKAEQSPEDTRSDFPGAGSLTWKYLGQWRLLTTIARGIVLETAHPAVGAGVVEFSTYRRHPYRRIEQTLLSIQRMTYQDPVDREREALRLRRLHSHINGIDQAGCPYSALDPDAQAWVHLTIFDAMVMMCELGGDALDDARQAELYAEWLVVGRQFGVPYDAMPATLAAYREYFDETVREKLVMSHGVEQLLDSLGRLPPPAQLSFVPEAVWGAVCGLLAEGARTFVVALLPEEFRVKMGDRGRLPFGAGALASIVCRTAAVVTDSLPVRWAYMPLAATFITARRETERSLRRAGLAGRNGSSPDPADTFVRILDQTGDGMLSWPDLASAARVFSDRLDLDEAAEAGLYAAFHGWWDELSATADTDGDGVVDAAEYRALVASEPGIAMEALMATVAAAVDRDGDGRIDHDDYARLVGREVDAVKRVRWLHALDEDGDGVVTVDEFAAALRGYVLGNARSDTLEYVLGRA